MRPTLLPLVALLAVAPLSAQTTPPAAPAAPAAFKMTPQQEADFLVLGKKYTRWFFAGAADSLASAFDAEMLKAVQGVPGIAEMMEKMSERLGAPSKVLVETMNYRNGLPQFWYEAEFSNFADEPAVIRWLFNAQGKIVGSGINPKSRVPAPDGM